MHAFFPSLQPPPRPPQNMDFVHLVGKKDTSAKKINFSTYTCACAFKFKVAAYWRFSLQSCHAMCNLVIRNRRGRQRDVSLYSFHLLTVWHLNRQAQRELNQNSAFNCVCTGERMFGKFITIPINFWICRPEVDIRPFIARTKDSALIRHCSLISHTPFPHSH